MTSQINVHLGSVDCGQIDSLHLAYAPEQHLTDDDDKLILIEDRNKCKRLLVACTLISLPVPLDSIVQRHPDITYNKNTNFRWSYPGLQLVAIFCSDFQLERVSIECRKSKTKIITLAN